MDKLTLHSVNAAFKAAASANTKANEVFEALNRRLLADCELANTLAAMIGAIYSAVNGGNAAPVDARFRDQLEATANSYGYTLADHPTRKDLVVITPLDN